MPIAAEGVKEGVLDPRESWSDKDAYDTAANSLMDAFRDRAKEMDINSEWIGWLQK